MGRTNSSAEPAPPIRTFIQLVQRAHDVEGVPLAELATYLNYPLRNPARSKGYVGNLMQLAFGRAPDSRPEADLERFRIEVKTVPVDTTLKALENTRVGRIAPSSLVIEESWTRSHAFFKVTAILLVPVVKHPRTPDHVGKWYARSPFVWMPSRDDFDVLEKDWMMIQDRYRSGAVTNSAIIGTYMIANTQSRTGKVTQEYVDSNGRQRTVKPKAFYLKKDLVTKILQETISFAQLLQLPRRGDEGNIAGATDEF